MTSLFSTVQAPRLSLLFKGLQNGRALIDQARSSRSDREKALLADLETIGRTLRLWDNFWNERGFPAPAEHQIPYQRFVEWAIQQPPRIWLLLDEMARKATEEFMADGIAFFYCRGIESELALQAMHAHLDRDPKSTVPTIQRVSRYALRNYVDPTPVAPPRRRPLEFPLNMIAEREGLESIAEAFRRALGSSHWKRTALYRELIVADTFFCAALGFAENKWTFGKHPSMLPKSSSPNGCLEWWLPQVPLH